MIKPTAQEYDRLSQAHRFVPLYLRIMGDSLTPVMVYRQLRELSPYSYLLESVEQDEKLGRFSFIGCDPLMVFRSKGQNIHLEEKGKKAQELQGNAFDQLQAWMDSVSLAEMPELAPFKGAVVGYFGYDCIRHIETIPDSNPDDLNLPDATLILPSLVVVFDHLYQSVSLVVMTDSKSPDAYQEGLSKMQMLKERLSNPKTQRITPLAAQPSKLEAKSNMTPDAYQEAVLKAKQYILEGDIFQVVLSQRFELEYQQDPFEIYRSLRRVNPSPYLFYLSYPDFKIAGSSPEILVKRERDQLTLRPIAGTRPRGKDPQEDQALADDLLQDGKEVAEHMMLVDLGRNDLGRICDFGSVKPTPGKFKYIEYYSHVMHIVTNLQGRLHQGIKAAGILQSTFPAGTLSGAPKVRAMEIIDELEVSKRGFYGGTVVHLDFGGDLDACIGIRSVVIKDQKAYVQAGAGIVADSVPAKEHEECQNKARAVIKAIQLVAPPIHDNLPR